jgi:plastocyanin
MAARELRVVVAFAAAAVVAPGVIASHAAGTAPTALQGVVRVAGRAAKDVVIWVDAPGGTTAPHAKARLDQRNMQFVPRVLAVRVGTSVEMPNSDRLLHNVFSFRDGKIFDLGLYPVGASQTVKFERAGLSRIFCNIHPTMAAYVLALDSDFFAVSDAQGRFTIDSVPGGTYTYHAWRAGKAATTGTLVADPDRPVEVELP